MPGQVTFRHDPLVLEGLRSRKKAKTRVSIEDAALALFDEQGYDATTVEQIAARAEVSTTTFFRYFPTKAEVLLSDYGQRLPALHDAILGRPAHESELVAVGQAVLVEWVAAIDPERTAHKARVVATSPVLQGLSYERGSRWLEVMTDALARRRGLDVPDERASLAARVVLSVLASAVEGWFAAECEGDLAETVVRKFDLMAEACGEWLALDSKRRTVVS
jgi:AcrR family transcriptional regulator